MQERLRTARQEDELPDVLLTLEHPPVYTRGRRSVAGELPMGEDWYLARGIEIVDTDRGGKVTYHGPGQLVGYPIVGVDDVVAYVRTLEDALVAALADEGVAARSRPREGHRFTGVWVERAQDRLDRRAPVAGRVSMHGFAVNVDNDLEPFSWIVPCGLDERADDVAGCGDGPGVGWNEVLPPAGAVARRGGARAPATAGQPCAARDPGEPVA